MVPLDQFIERVLESGVLSKSMVELQSPATQFEIEAAEYRLGMRLPVLLLTLLRRWNGASLDLIRLIPCDELELKSGGLYFANDPAGFQYLLDGDGAVLQLDTDGGEVKQLANDIQDFLAGLVFGPRGSEFAGDEWAAELRAAGLAT
jgi:hypothetical protein